MRRREVVAGLTDAAAFRCSPIDAQTLLVSPHRLSYVHKVRNGAKPSDLPIEQPTSFDLVINLGTAREFGLAVPPALLAQADRVIE